MKIGHRQKKIQLTIKWHIEMVRIIFGRKYIYMSWDVLKKIIEAKEDVKNNLKPLFGDRAQEKVWLFHSENAIMLTEY
jgi:hypothetical protein